MMCISHIIANFAQLIYNVNCQNKNMIKIIIRTLWALLLLGLFACFMLFFSINKGWIGYMPPLEDLENPDYKFATQVFSADGRFFKHF